MKTKSYFLGFNLGFFNGGKDVFEFLEVTILFLVKLPSCINLDKFKKKFNQAPFSVYQI